MDGGPEARRDVRAIHVLRVSILFLMDGGPEAGVRYQIHADDLMFQSFS